MVSLFQTATLYRKNLDRELMLERERTRIAQDMHDEIGSSLTHISILGEVMKKNIGDKNETKRLIDQVSGISGGLVDELNNIIWALNPGNDTLSCFLSYIRRYTSEYLVDTKISAECIFSENIPELPMTSDQRRNLFLVIKEAINNSVKYSGATTLQIRISLSEDLLSVTVKDDGTGFDLDACLNKGNGLTNMRKRVESLSGSFRVESGIGLGTTIAITVQLIPGSGFKTTF
jgi:signal transduction histidine kinase